MQDAILNKDLKERAARISHLRKIREGLINTYADEKDPGLRLSLFDVIGNLASREKLIMDEVI